MHDFDWDHLRHFLATVEEGSVSRAGEKLGVNYTTVSRRIRSLEKSLDVSLFDRNGPDWVLTSAGEKILTAAEEMSESAGVAFRSAMVDREEVSGLLRVTAISVFMEHMLMEGIHEFQKKYPDICFELISSSEVLSLSARKADVAFRATNNPPENVLGRKICYIDYAVYGTKELAEAFRHGDPVPTITWIGDGRTKPEWIMRNVPNTTSILRLNTIESMMEAARHGMGLAQVPCWMGDTAENLVYIPEVQPEPGCDFWILAHADLRKTVRVRLFRDHMIKKVSTWFSENVTTKPFQ